MFQGYVACWNAVMMFSIFQTYNKVSFLHRNQDNKRYRESSKIQKLSRKSKLTPIIIKAAEWLHMGLFLPEQYQELTHSSLEASICIIINALDSQFKITSLIFLQFSFQIHRYFEILKHDNSNKILHIFLNLT